MITKPQRLLSAAFQNSSGEQLHHHCALFHIQPPLKLLFLSSSPLPSSIHHPPLVSGLSATALLSFIICSPTSGSMLFAYHPLQFFIFARLYLFLTFSFPLNETISTSAINQNDRSYHSIYRLLTCTVAELPTSFSFGHMPSNGVVDHRRMGTDTHPPNALLLLMPSPLKHALNRLFKLSP